MNSEFNSSNNDDYENHVAPLSPEQEELLRHAEENLGKMPPSDFENNNVTPHHVSFGRADMAKTINDDDERDWGTPTQFRK